MRQREARRKNCDPVLNCITGYVNVAPQIMDISHQGFTTVLSDDWWIEAGMEKFVPTSRAFITDDLGATEVKICDIGPLSETRRNLGIFLDSIHENRTARERVLWILLRMRRAEPLCPVAIKPASSHIGFKYELANGAHRLHLSIAVGFTHIPAILLEEVW